MKMNLKWNNAFFIGINLIPSYWLYLNKAVGYTLESYLKDMRIKSRRRLQNGIRRAKEKGEEYYTPRTHQLDKHCNIWVSRMPK